MSKPKRMGGHSRAGVKDKKPRVPRNPARQDGKPPGRVNSLTPAHVRFCEMYVEHGNAAKARRECGLVAVLRPEQSGAFLLKNELVKAKIAELRASTARLASLSRGDIVEYLADVVKTPIGSLTSNSRMVQAYDPTSGKITMVSKMDAIDRLCRILGYYEPVKVEASLESKLIMLFADMTGATRPTIEAIEVEALHE